MSALRSQQTVRLVSIADSLWQNCEQIKDRKGGSINGTFVNQATVSLPRDG